MKRTKKYLSLVILLSLFSTAFVTVINIENSVEEININLPLKPTAAIRVAEGGIHLP